MKEIKITGKLACTLVLLLISVSCVIVTAQNQESKDLSGFTKISFSISGDLYVKQAKEFSVKLEGAETDIAKIITKVDGNSLVVKNVNHSGSIGKVKVFVTLPELTGINLAGSGDVYVSEAIATEKMKLSVSGSGDILFNNLQANNAMLTVTGSGDIDVSGVNSGKLDVTITGSGNINAAEFKSTDVEVDITGSGSAKVWATGNLETNIVGSGSVRYKGKPLVDANSVGSGSTRPQ